MSFDEWWKASSYKFHDERTPVSTAVDFARAAWLRGFAEGIATVYHSSVDAERNRCASICKDYPDLVGQIRRYSSG